MALAGEALYTIGVTKYIFGDDTDVASMKFAYQWIDITENKENTFA